MNCSVCPMVCAGVCGASQVRSISPVGPNPRRVPWKDMLPWQGGQGQALDADRAKLQSNTTLHHIFSPTHTPTFLHSSSSSQPSRAAGKEECRAGAEGGRSALAICTLQPTPRACWCPQSNYPGNQICQNLVPFVRSVAENKSMGLEH